jgi:hypothetical protein
MLGPKVLITTLFAALAVPSLATGIPDLTTVSQQIQNAQNVLAGYNGGYVGALSCARQLFVVQQACKDARNTFQGGESLAPQDVEGFVDQMEDFHTLITDTLQVATSKVCNHLLSD